MRRRSCTLHAETFEEYTALAIQPSVSSDISRVRSRNSSLPLLRPKPYISSPILKKEEDYQASPKVDSVWGDFDFKTKSREDEDLCSNSTAETSDHNSNSIIEAESLDSPTLFSGSKISKSLVTKRFMVMNSSSTNSHNLINSSFKGNEEMELTPLKQKQAMDLIVKSDEEEGVKCHFWLKAIEEKRFESLVKVYYKSASAFIFVYSIANRESFNWVEEAIQEVLKDVSREKFVGILVGNKTNEGAREVSEMEGDSLQKKYDLAEFCETSSGESTLKEKLFGTFNLNLYV
jgi:hypothetical protein